MSNRFIIAAAGSGKTTFVINEALSRKTETILITTYTDENKDEIEKKIINKVGCIPANITIMTWFRFLLMHGVRPYQGVVDEKLHNIKIGFYLTNQKSGHRYGNVYWGENNFKNFYFTHTFKIYSDKISKFVIRCNKESNDKVIKRISDIFQNIYIDEVQDLTGYDLDILSLLFKSISNVCLVGDPRQVTYLTHVSKKYGKYSNGRLQFFIENEINKKSTICDIDNKLLNVSHRNNDKICFYSSKLYPEYTMPKACTCECCRKNTTDHEGIFIIKKNDTTKYLEKYNLVMQLRWSVKIPVNEKYPCINIGKSKGRTFERVLLYPTKDMGKWISDNSIKLSDSTRAKFYVALTRARHSVAIVMNYNDSDYFDDLEKYLFK